MLTSIMFTEPELKRQETRKQLELLRKKRDNLDRHRRKLKTKLRDAAKERARLKAAIWRLENPARERKTSPSAPIAAAEPLSAPPVTAPPSADPVVWAEFWKDKLKAPPPAPDPPPDVDKG